MLENILLNALISIHARDGFILRYIVPSLQKQKEFPRYLLNWKII